MNFAVLLAYILAIVLLIGTPGPIVALVINAASRHGFKYALITVLGTNLASLLLLATAALMISGVIALDAHNLQWISLVGCAFIGWMALAGLRSELGKHSHAPPVSTAAVKHHSAFANGFLLGVANPKDIIFFVAFFPQFISVTSHFKLSLTLLALIWIVVDFMILLGYVLLMRGGFFQRHKRKIALMSSAFLLLIALIGMAYTLIGWQGYVIIPSVLAA